MFTNPWRASHSCLAQETKETANCPQETKGNRYYLGALLSFFWGFGFPTKMDYREKLVPLLRPSLVEDRLFSPRYLSAARRELLQRLQCQLRPRVVVHDEGRGPRAYNSERRRKKRPMESRGLRARDKVFSHSLSSWTSHVWQVFFEWQR